MTSIGQVVDYIFARKDNTYLADWSWLDIKDEVENLIEHREIRIHTNAEGMVDGCVLYTIGTTEQPFFVDQIWADNHTVVKDFLTILKYDYPYVTTIYGNRLRRKSNTREKNVKFNLTTLEKVFNYGRRSSSTNTTRVNRSNASSLC